MCVCVCVVCVSAYRSFSNIVMWSCFLHIECSSCAYVWQYGEEHSCDEGYAELDKSPRHSAVNDGALQRDDQGLSLPTVKVLCPNMCVPPGWHHRRAHG